jgi:hypothetical protein
MDRHVPEIQPLYWSEAREYVAQVRPELVEIIDQISPSKRHKIYKVKYPYGSSIVNHGVLHLPVNGEVVSIDSDRISPELKKDLAYDGMPIGIPIKNSIELFLRFNHSTIVSSLLKTGHVFGLWHALEPSVSSDRGSMWYITAGARSLIMLPKITEASSHKRLQSQFQIASSPPDSMYDQWNVFKEISERADSHDHWHVELLFFSNSWLEHKTDPLWMTFYHALLQRAWYHSAFARNKEMYDFILSVAYQQSNLKPDPYLADTVKYLLYMSLSKEPAFCVPEDETAAPINAIQKAYVEIYKLKHYIPTLLQPGYFSDTNTLYYSLQHPVLKSISPKARKEATKLFDLESLQHILLVLSRELLKNQFHQEGYAVSLYNVIKNTEFSFFHTGAKQANNSLLLPPEQLFAEDPALQKQLEQFPGRIHCENSPFLKGCIRVRKKKEVI